MPPTLLATTGRERAIASGIDCPLRFGTVTERPRIELRNENQAPTTKIATSRAPYPARKRILFTIES
jgi:hypothetical protein